MRAFVLTFIFASIALIAKVYAEDAPSYHIVGWANAFVPGAGQVILGNTWRGFAEAGAETGTFALGYSWSKLSPLSIDGVPEDLPKFGTGTRRSSSQVSLTKPLYADLLQEVGIKAHMVDTFYAYRLAATQNGVTEGIDQRPILDMFLSPFQKEYLFDPWVLGPLVAVIGYTIYDYYATLNSGLQGIPRLNPYTNFLYSVNYTAWQPFGSGAPEELFYRGFLQHELYGIVPSPFFSIPLSAAAFAFSHEAGPGRITAAVAGTYLGYLAHRYKGNLGAGMTLHFWGVVFLGIETVLLAHEAQHTTPPGGLYLQFNY